MTASGEAERDTADAIAFALLRRAFLILAEAHVASDRERGLRHLHELQHDAVTTIRNFVDENPDKANAPVFLEAVTRLRDTLRQAMGLPDEGAGRQ